LNNKQLATRFQARTIALTCMGGIGKILPFDIETNVKKAVQAQNTVNPSVAFCLKQH